MYLAMEKEPQIMQVNEESKGLLFFEGYLKQYFIVVIVGFSFSAELLEIIHTSIIVRCEQPRPQSNFKKDFRLSLIAKRCARNEDEMRDKKYLLVQTNATEKCFVPFLFMR